MAQDVLTVNDRIDLHGHLEIVLRMPVDLIDLSQANGLTLKPPTSRWLADRQDERLMARIVQLVVVVSEARAERLS